jgi:hypothetical protein
MAKEIALGLNLVFLVLLMHNNAISCFDLVAKPKAYMMSCASGECQEAISNCVNMWHCLGVKPCQKCLAYYPQCDSACGIDLFDKDEYLSVNGFDYLPCESSNQKQVAACALHCRGRYFTGSELTTTQTIRPQTTTESTTVASTLLLKTELQHIYWVWLHYYWLFKTIMQRTQLEWLSSVILFQGKVDATVVDSVVVCGRIVWVVVAVVVVIVVVWDVLVVVEEDVTEKSLLKHLQTGNPSTLEHSLPVK